VKLHFWTLSSALLILIILFLSFYPFETSEKEPFFKHQDKIAHFLLYFSLTFSLIKSFKGELFLVNPFFLSASISFSFGTLIEILQPILTEYREGSFYDAIFNLLGIVFTLIIFTFKKSFFGSRN
tara:strand:- start:9674 stop:10048 length:375 start_codon:yes stop_codon:yes gene_type:complete